MRTRLLVGGVGFLLAAYGVVLLADDSASDLLGLVVWLAAGVVLHDLVLAPLVIGLAWVAARVLPDVARGPVVAGAVVLGSVTLLAVPVLGRFGASPGNDTLLDRDYVAGWLVLAGLTAAAVGTSVLLRVRRRRGVRAGR